MKALKNILKIMTDTNMSGFNNNGVVSWTSHIGEDYDENAYDD